MANALRAPYHLGDQEILQSLFAAAGLRTPVTITTQRGTARFPSLGSWLYTDIKGWVLADQLDDAQFELLCREARRELASYRSANGCVALDAPAHIASC